MRKGPRAQRTAFTLRIQRAQIQTDYAELVPEDPLGAQARPVYYAELSDCDSVRGIGWRANSLPCYEAAPGLSMCKPNTPARCLPAFLKLEGAAPSRVLEFAHEWGPLGLCIDGGLHSSRRCRARPSREKWRLAYHSCPGLWHEGFPWEPLKDWERYIAMAVAMMGVAADVLRGEATRQEDWHAIAQVLPSAAQVNPRDSFKAKWELMGALNYWLGNGDVSVQASWYLELTPTARISFTLLCHRIGLEMLAALGQGAFRCHSCKKPYTIEKDPQRSGEPRRPSLLSDKIHNYCPTCRDEDYRIARRQRDRDRYWKKHADRLRTTSYGTKN